MNLARSRRTRPTVSSGAEAGCSFREGVITLQLAHTSRNIVDDPMVEASRKWGVIVRHEHHKALRPCRHILPVKLGSNIGARTAELIQLMFR